MYEIMRVGQPASCAALPRGFGRGCEKREEPAIRVRMPGGCAVHARVPRIPRVLRVDVPCTRGKGEI